MALEADETWKIKEILKVFLKNLHVAKKVLKFVLKKVES